MTTEDEVPKAFREFVTELAEELKKVDIAAILIMADDFEMLKVVYTRITTAIKEKRGLSLNECRMMYNAFRVFIDEVITISTDDLTTVVEAIKSKRDAEEKEKQAATCGSKSKH